jgi:hypothetical protein
MIAHICRQIHTQRTLVEKEVGCVCERGELEVLWRLLIERRGWGVTGAVLAPL